MEQKTKRTIGIVVLVGIALLAGGIWYGVNRKTPYKEAYQACLESVSGGEPKELEQYCSCLVSAPEGILNKDEYLEWLDLYAHDGEKAQERFGGRSDLNQEMFACFLKHGPFSTWALLWMSWCPDNYGTSIAACECMLDAWSESLKPEEVKFIMGRATELVPVEETPEETAKFKAAMKDLVTYCSLEVGAEMSDKEESTSEK